MLVIREEQRTVLRRQLLAPFHLNLFHHLRMAFHQQTERMSDPELKELIWSGMEKACAYGVSKEADVARFIEYMACYGTHFETGPESDLVGTILRSVRMDGTAKMAAIDDFNERNMRPSRSELLSSNLKRLGERA
ncbi:hypothetical protein [Vitiosangium sp. GDMCC 1.1324]|uniref:hypothetical protein n=1 Tax=Vitiosangium sp. (strain GDMCC 1.1324) TaxID=2138576 RepID=UPI000D34281C|nr:hypothetical protein [Vitiosangium sp. GDMCC 1.1324]PTL81616.1 hypothetical protein DAT35_21930 [Vitiosangium sp. GDMCC 1.1324]